MLFHTTQDFEKMLGRLVSLVSKLRQRHGSFVSNLCD